MSSFTKPLTVTKLSNGLWEVSRSFTYYVGEEGSKEKIRVPIHFKTDFASVPRPFWIIIPPDGEYSQAAVLHDYLYYTQGINNKYSRVQSDKIFLEGMEVLNVSLWKRLVMYRAVRMFGWLPWGRYKKVKDEN